MKWICLLAVSAGCAISALLGMTAGLNLNPQSTVRFIPAWGSLGDWFSGVGAFSAVAASLWLARRGERLQSAKEKDEIRIEQRIAKMYAHLHIISTGHYPVTIKRVLIGINGGGALGLDLIDPDGNEIKMPLRLGFGEEIHASWRIDQDLQLLKVISWLRPFTLDVLKIEVVTVMGMHEVAIDSNLVAWLQDAAQRHGVELLRP